MIRHIYRWFLARFRLNLQVVCEESAGLGPQEDYHDYPDDEHGQPWHFTLLRCKRCGKEFYISFAYDQPGDCCVVQGLGWLWKKPGFTRTNLPWAYLALLNSRVFLVLLSLSCRRMRGGQFDLYPEYSKKVFMPDLSDEAQISSGVVNGLMTLGHAIAKGESFDVEILDQMVAQAYGIPLGILRGYDPKDRQESGGAQLEKNFLALAEAWREETGMLSSVTKRLRHPAYQQIIGLGPKVLPLILKELRDRPDYWFAALKSLSGENPVLPQDKTDPRRVREAWLKWGKENKYL